MLLCCIFLHKRWKSINWSIIKMFKIIHLTLEKVKPRFNIHSLHKQKIIQASIWKHDDYKCQIMKNKKITLKKIKHGILGKVLFGKSCCRTLISYFTQTPARVSRSVGYTIIWWSADLTVVQKPVKLVVQSVLYPSTFMETWVDGRSVVFAQAKKILLSWGHCQAK